MDIDRAATIPPLRFPRNEIVARGHVHLWHPVAPTRLMIGVLHTTVLFALCWSSFILWFTPPGNVEELDAF